MWRGCGDGGLCSNVVRRMLASSETSIFRSPCSNELSPGSLLRYSSSWLGVEPKFAYRNGQTLHVRVECSIGAALRSVVRSVKRCGCTKHKQSQTINTYEYQDTKQWAFLGRATTSSIRFLRGACEGNKLFALARLVETLNSHNRRTGKAGDIPEKRGVLEVVHWVHTTIGLGLAFCGPSLKLVVVLSKKSYH